MIRIKTLNYRGNDVTLAVTNYQKEKMCMALYLINKNNELFNVITVNLGNDIGNNSFMQRGCAFVDTNNNFEIEKFIKDNKLGEPYIRFGEPVIVQSGFCEYPLYRFDINKLKELDPIGFEKYNIDYQSAYKELLEKQNQFEENNYYF